MVVGTRTSCLIKPLAERDELFDMDQVRRVGPSLTTGRDVYGSHCSLSFRCETHVEGLISNYL